MKTDRELLELAAKAAGYETWWGRDHQDEMLFMRLKNPDPTGKCSGIGWNPLTDDGDALRLAADALGVIEFVIDEWPDEEAGVMRRKVNKPATRRAIVRAAAVIGEAMQ